jgi:hypothetical protein
LSSGTLIHSNFYTHICVWEIYSLISNSSQEYCLELTLTEHVKNKVSVFVRGLTCQKRTVELFC